MTELEKREILELQQKINREIMEGKTTVADWVVYCLIDYPLLKIRKQT